MIRIQIGNNEKRLTDVDESWITQQINRRRADGQKVCVRVFIETGDINVVLSTPECPKAAYGKRPPNKSESKILDLWEKRGLRKDDYTGGNLIAFLNQIKGEI